MCEHSMETVFVFFSQSLETYEDGGLMVSLADLFRKRQLEKQRKQLHVCETPGRKYGEPLQKCVKK